MMTAIDRLLRERQMTALRDRRAADRQPFVRPVLVVVPRFELPLTGFSRDLSLRGISIITACDVGVGQVGTIEIHSVLGPPVTLRAESRWSDEFGPNWHVSGWAFLDAF